LETVLKAMHEGHLATPINNQGIHVRCLSLGAYVGEVLRREIGQGVWRRDSEYGEYTFPLELPNVGSVFPTMWCRKRIENGEGDNVAFKARVVLSIAQGEGPFPKV
jgi:hypothetical protein